MLPLRRMPFRRQILPFLQSQIIRSLYTRTVSDPGPADKKTGRRKQAPFAEPYRTTLNLHPYSCDWDNWDHYEFFDVQADWYDLSEMEFFVKRLTKVPDTIRPLAFIETLYPCLAFEAAGKYYWLDTTSSYLERFGGGWLSHDAFLAAFIRTQPPVLKGEVYNFPDETDHLFVAVSREQQRRAAKAFDADAGTSLTM
ncbi:hypothetical protein C8F01DRAFT_1368873 [Mycena amicta]|nr:hypothetical protein C8F01DRAFT_1368873 [Mycena amicta]